MAYSTEQHALRRSLAVLRRIGVVPQAAPGLDADIADVGRALRQAILDEVPAFMASANPQVLPELEQHSQAHVEEIRRLFGGGATGDFEFVKQHARRRASQHFPLEAVLHAYRCGHKVLLGWIRDAAVPVLHDDVERAASAVADFAVEYTNVTSTIAAAEYVATIRRLAEAEGDRRTELLNVLLGGYDEADGRVARLLKRAGYRAQRQSFCIALAQSVDPSEMENPARVQRIVDALTDAVGDLRIRSLIGVRDNVVVAVFSDTRRQSGWTAPQTALAERIRPALLTLGPAVVIGLSADQPSTAHIPRAYQEAKIALDSASVTERVTLYSALPIRRLLVHVAGDEIASALPQWTDAFLTANDKSRGALVATLRAYADADMNILETARQLDVHPNTIYARMQRIEDLTGLGAQHYHALTELLLAVDCSGESRDS